MRRLPLAILALLLLLPGPEARAQRAPEPTHDEIRAMRDGLLDAVNRGDMDTALTYLDKDVVVTWENAEVCHGPDEVRAYYDRMMKGPDRFVQSFHTDVTVDALTTLYGENTGVAVGSSHDSFVLMNGTNFTVDGRWTATMVRQNGRWVIAALHTSTDMFDNPIVRRWKGLVYFAGIFALLFGAIAGFGLALLFRRKRA